MTGRVNGWAPLLWALNLTDEGLTTFTRLLLVILAKYADHDGKCFPTLARLARELRTSKRSVQRAISDLEAAGFVAVERGTGRGHSSEYQLQMTRTSATKATPERVTRCHLLPGERVTNTTVKGDTSVTPTLQGLSSRRITPNGVAQSAPDGVVKGGVRLQLWQDGTPIVQALTGLPPRKARGLLGRLLKLLDDDCARLMAILIDAEETKPIDPEGWLVSACQRGKRSNARGNVISRIREDWGLPSYGDAAMHLDDDDEGESTAATEQAPRMLQ
jgi:hypothetical protein